MKRTFFVFLSGVGKRSSLLRRRKRSSLVLRGEESVFLLLFFSLSAGREGEDVPCFRESESKRGTERERERE